MTNLDGYGKACPLPVIMVKTELEKKDFDGDDIVIRVDNAIAVKNLEKLAKSYGLSIESKDIEGGFEVRFLIAGNECKLIEELDLSTLPREATVPAYLITRNVVGSGNDELGATLMQMFLFSITQMDHLPKTIAFMNSGVHLATLNEETIETLKDLEAKGVKILVCGACLNFYGLADQVKVGEVSNAYEILSTLQHSPAITI